MKKISFKELSVPLIKSIDSFNYLLKSHHRKTAVISYNIGKKLGLTGDQMVDLVIAASLHDVGALSVQERDELIQEDVENPEPHCLMGHKMLSSFDLFSEVAQIIKYHHIKYEQRDKQEDEVKFQSHILHLSDRVDIYYSDHSKLESRLEVTEKIKERVGTIFHPAVFEAFVDTAKNDSFWFDIDNLSMENLFKKIHFPHDQILTTDQMVQFALVVSRIIDFRSKFTASHSYTVGYLAGKIGKMIDLDNEFCTKLLIAGLLHDIGKIGINPYLIEKNGPLTDEEYNQVKQHCYYTGQILSELKTTNSFKNIIYWAEHHHEKIDGSGYPYGCRGDEIDLGTKIIAYSDIISALMEDRPYREGLGFNKAFKIIEQEFSNKLDFDLFLKLDQNKERIKEIVTQCHRESRDFYSRKIEVPSKSIYKIFS